MKCRYCGDESRRHVCDYCIRDRRRPQENKKLLIEIMKERGDIVDDKTMVSLMFKELRVPVGVSVRTLQEAREECQSTEYGSTLR